MEEVVEQQQQQQQRQRQQWQQRQQRQRQQQRRRQQQQQDDEQQQQQQQKDCSCSCHPLSLSFHCFSPPFSVLSPPLTAVLLPAVTCAKRSDEALRLAASIASNAARPARHPELKISTPAHTKHPGWCVDLGSRGIPGSGGPATAAAISSACRLAAPVDSRHFLGSGSRAKMAGNTLSVQAANRCSPSNAFRRLSSTT